MTIVNYRGLQVLANVQRATKQAIDETTEAAVQHARDNHSWVSRTGTLEASLRNEEAEQEGDDIVGRWGSTVSYAIFLELGTVHSEADPFIRPAGDAEHPKLARRIKVNLLK